MSTFKERVLLKTAIILFAWLLGVCMLLISADTIVRLTVPAALLSYLVLLFLGVCHLQFFLDKKLNNQLYFNRRFVPESVVDEKLVELARDFYRAEVEYAEACSTISKKVMPTEEEESELASLKKRCEDEKKRFWGAHGLAEWFDYEVHPKYKDYLATTFTPRS